MDELSKVKLMKIYTNARGERGAETFVQRAEAYREKIDSKTDLDEDDFLFQQEIKHLIELDYANQIFLNSLTRYEGYSAQSQVFLEEADLEEKSQAKGIEKIKNQKMGYPQQLKERRMAKIDYAERMITSLIAEADGLMAEFNSGNVTEELYRKMMNTYSFLVEQEKGFSTVLKAAYKTNIPDKYSDILKECEKHSIIEGNLKIVPDKCLVDGTWGMYINPDFFEMSDFFRADFDTKKIAELDSAEFELLYDRAKISMSDEKKSNYSEKRHYIKAIHATSRKYMNAIGQLAQSKEKVAQIVTRAFNKQATREDILFIERYKELAECMQITGERYQAWFLDREVKEMLENKSGAFNALQEDVNTFLTYNLCQFAKAMDLIFAPMGMYTLTYGDDWKLKDFTKKENGEINLDADFLMNFTAQKKDKNVLIQALNALIELNMKSEAYTDLENARRTPIELFSEERKRADELLAERDGAQMTDEEVELRMADLEAPESILRSRLIAAGTEEKTMTWIQEEYLKRKAIGQKGRKYESGISQGETKAPELFIGDMMNIDNYTTDSAAYRKAVTEKGVALNETNKVRAINAMLKGVKESREISTSVSYRFAKYAHGQNPFGVDAMSSIHVGDYVTDPGVVSTSANKAMIQPGPMAAISSNHVTMSIVGQSGVPIAVDTGKYSNRTLALAGTAGQAEILYPSNTIFRVAGIKQDEKGNSRVVLEEVESVPEGSKVLDMYTGKPTQIKPQYSYEEVKR